MLKRLFWIIMLFVYVWCPLFNINYTIYLDLQFYFAVLAIFLVGDEISAHLNQPLTKAILVFFLISLIVALPGCLTTDIVYGLRSFLRIFKGGVMFLGAGALVLLFNRSYKDDWSLLLRWIYYGIGLHGCICLGQFYFEGFYNQTLEWFLLGVSEEVVNESLLRDMAFRVPGLASTGGGAVSFLQSLGIVMLPFVIRFEKNIVSLFFIAFFAFIDIYTFILNGRTGIYLVALLFIPMLYFSSRISKKGDLYRFSFIYFIFWCFCGVILVLTIVYIAKNTQQFPEKISSAIERNMDMLGGNDATFLKNDSLEMHVEKLWLWPTTETQWVIGDPEVIYDRRLEESTDNGYSRILIGYGIFSLISQSLIYFAPFIYLIIHRRNLDKIGLCAILVFSAHLIMNWKDLTFFARISFPMLSIIYFATMMSLNENAIVKKLPLYPRRNDFQLH